ncbi:MAG: DNA methyltransferase [Bacteroidales bacterium]|nr:DNA methyltransferase [Bacteroidales bacterium]
MTRRWRKHTLRLSGYDFETDVDVNILGHIFEHSIGEIESVQAEIRGEAVDRQKTQRKKEGIFYTPKYITKYIVENTVGRLCEEKRQELGIVDEEYTKGRRHRKMATLKALNQKLDDYRVWLLSLTILDPACGSGAFLNQALDFLIKEHGKIDELRAELLGESLVLSDITNDILENNIYGVDLNEESVEIAKLSLWLRTAQKGRRLNTLSQNIKCGNSLIDDPAVAGNKAFNWQQEFPGVFKKKNKKAWHVTWVTHDTRTSERMKKYRVRERKASGEMHVDRSVILEENDALKVTEIIADIIIENNFNCLAYNICHDHVHILLVCEKEELPGIVRKLKGKSAQKFKEYLGISKEETYNLWAQKFNWKEIESDKQLENVIEYIKTNRERHELPNINEAEQSYNNEAQSSNNRPLEEKTRGCSPLSESSLLSNEQGTNDQNSHDMKDEKDLHSNGDENENHHHNKEPQSHNKESQPHNKEPQSHNKESQPHNKESQYHNKGSQSHNKESQSHNKESQSHNKESQPHNKEPQYHNKESQPHNKESQYHNKGLQPLVNRPNRPKQPLAIQHQQTLQSLIDKMTCSYSHAFRPEYMGGFDVIIGNPPYVRAELSGEIREHLEANYSVFQSFR